MNPAQIIEKAKSIGVSLHLTEKQSIGFKGEGKSIDEVMPLLQAHKAELIQWLEFCDLYAYVAIKSDWVDADTQQWRKDLTEQPKLTMECLRALKHSWNRCGYGCLTPTDWVSGETKNELHCSVARPPPNFLRLPVWA